MSHGFYERAERAGEEVVIEERCRRPFDDASSYGC
jgi:hypothetical protein